MEDKQEYFLPEKFTTIDTELLQSPKSRQSVNGIHPRFVRFTLHKLINLEALSVAS